MKRILQVLGSLQRGGAETMIMNIYRNINRENYQFDFLVKDRIDDGYEREVLKLGGHIFQVESAKKIGIFKYVMQQRKIMKENKYDVVHSHVNTLSGFTLLSAKLAGIKLRIAHSHNTKFKTGKMMNFIGKILIRLFSNKRIACGKEAGVALFGNKKFDILPNAIEIQKFLFNNQFEKNNLRSKLKISSNKIIICHIGRFNEVKNHQFILQLAKNLDQEKFELHLLGDGELFEKIKSQINAEAISNVILHGSVSNANEYLKASDIFILPSLYEGLPVTLVEAQCAGLICIIADNITNEVDFGINLIKYLPLQINLWEKELASEYNNNNISPSDILESISKKGYSIESGVKLVEKYYDYKSRREYNWTK